MAVPKKRRIGYKILNRGSQTRGWYLRVVNSTLSGAPLSYLGRLIGISKPALPKAGLPLLVVRPLPRAKPFDREVRPFSEIAVIHQFRHRVFWDVSTAKASANCPLHAFAAWRLLAKPVRTAYSPLGIPLLTINSQMVKITSKGLLSSLQLPHKWGPQRGFLLKRWELLPAHYYLSGVPKPRLVTAPQGYWDLNRPINLSRPKGPSLRGLWLYIKANPNEGYWMYCMWLQIVKKWKRWLSFPYQYFVKRNVWRRLRLVRLFYSNLSRHSSFYLRPKKFFFKKKLVALFEVSALTNVALFVNALRPLGATPPRRGGGGGAPVSRRRALRYQGYTPLSLFSFVFSSLRRYFRNPIK